MALMEASLLILVFTIHCNAAVTSTPPEPGPTKPPAGTPAPPEPTQPKKPPMLPSLPVTEIRSCPKDVPRVDCPVNPCVLLRCPLKGAECVVDSCGKCRPRWIKDRKEVTMECLESLKLCADGSVPQKCEVNPCDTARCPAVAGAVCVADFCGGCRDRWIHDDMEVTKECKVPASYESIFRGPRGPCPAFCVAFPDAVCVNIGGFYHVWFVFSTPGGIRDVTHMCDRPRLDEVAFLSQHQDCWRAKCHHPQLRYEARCRPCGPAEEPRRCIHGRVWLIGPDHYVTEECEFGL